MTWTTGPLETLPIWQGPEIYLQFSGICMCLLHSYLFQINIVDPYDGLEDIRMIKISPNHIMTVRDLT